MLDKEKIPPKHSCSCPLCHAPRHCGPQQASQTIYGHHLFNADNTPHASLWSTLVMITLITTLNIVSSESLATVSCLTSTPPSQINTTPNDQSSIEPLYICVIKMRTLWWNTCWHYLVWTPKCPILLSVPNPPTHTLVNWLKIKWQRSFQSHTIWGGNEQDHL